MIARTLSILILFIAASLAVRAQTTGSLSGWITDGSGRPLAGAVVIVLGTTPLRGGVVKADGSYRVVGIKAGRYQIAIRAAGFKEQHKDATIDIDAETKLNVELEVNEEQDYGGIGRRRPCCLYTRGRAGTEHHITPKEEGWIPYMW
ncbi:MAG: carboxypeptidase-like regulatory domain-containing protein [Candidatus Kapaibacterium sp.]